MTPREALMAAIDVLGSQKAVAAAAGADVETGHVYYWLNKANEVPARYCPGIERETREKGTPISASGFAPAPTGRPCASRVGRRPRPVRSTPLRLRLFASSTVPPIARRCSKATGPAGPAARGADQ